MCFAFKHGSDYELACKEGGGVHLRACRLYSVRLMHCSDRRGRVLPALTGRELAVVCVRETVDIVTGLLFSGPMR